MKGLETHPMLDDKDLEYYKLRREVSREQYREAMKEESKIKKQISRVELRVPTEYLGEIKDIAKAMREGTYNCWE